MYERLEEYGGQAINIDFYDTPEELKVEYLDVSEGVSAEILYAAEFDKNTNLGTTYLGRIDMTRSDKIKAEERFQYESRLIHKGNYKKVQFVRYYWTKELVNNSCPKHTI